MRRLPLWLFVRMSRPLFLLGGFLLYGLGLAVAVHRGATLDLDRLIAGLALVLMIQLSIHYSNEYFDSEADASNRNRTPFSGGSGAVGDQGLRRSVARWATIVCLATALLIGVRMVTLRDMSAIPIRLALGGFLVAFAYSSPPVRLVASGLGELPASVVVAGVVPAIAFSLQTHTLDPIVLGAVLPLVALHFSMLLTFELPDEAPDRGSGKRTLVVRLGGRLSRVVIRAATLLAVVGFLVGLRLGVPDQVALTTAFALPLAFAHWQMIGRTIGDRRPPWTLTTGVALSLFALTAVLEAVGFLLAGHA
jgi:1,4-dihydroxy-2-naphthoate octaprenyltransferase